MDEIRLVVMEEIEFENPNMTESTSTIKISGLSRYRSY